MKVAIDISPIKTGHRIRGIGTYTEKLTEEFKSKNFGIQFTFFENYSSPPPADVIHYPYFDLFRHTLPFYKPSARVVTIHDVIPLVFPKCFPQGIRGSINLFFQKRSLSNVNAVICDSKTSKDDIASKLLFPPEKIHVIYLAPGQNFKKIKEKSKLSRIIQKYNLPKDFILYVGDVNWNKNIPNLLRAVKAAKVSLVMVGKATVDKNLSETKEIEKLIKKLKIESKVTRTGYISEDDLVAIYNLASLTVLPSFYEGFGLPVLESMACGTPVVCSKVASLAEIADPIGIFCNPDNFQDIAAKISQALNFSEKEKELLSQKSIEHVSKFTWEKVARETIKVYIRLQKTVGS